MTQPLENKDSPTLRARLQSLGFEQVEFEPKVNNRFVVHIKNFPSYVVKSVRFPKCKQGNWEGIVEIECYNPIGAKLEQMAVDLVSEKTVPIIVKILSPVAEIDTTWEIVGTEGSVEFDPYNWSDDGQANLLKITFLVITAKITY